MSNEELVNLYQSGDKAALDKLIDANTGLIKKIANKFNGINKELEFDDLFQIGCMALIEAAQGYKIDLENRSKFVTYSFLIIKQRILEYVNGKTSKDSGNNELYSNCSRLNAPIDSEEQHELIDTIKGDDNSIENIEDKLYLEQLRRELEQAMKDNNTLEEINILKLYYGWNFNSMQLIEIADLFDTSVNKMQGKHSRALRKLRNSMWVRTYGILYRDEIIGPQRLTYDSVMKKIDEQLAWGERYEYKHS